MKQDWEVLDDNNEYFMEYNIYLNGMRVGVYLLDHAANGNINETTSYYCLYDGQGNIVQISNKIGDLPYYLFKYDTYGNTLETQTNGEDSEPAGYKGYSESAIYFKTGARHYDSNTGTFMTPDPFKGYMEEPQSQLPYMYCEGNPVNYYDPSGYTGETIVQAGAGIIYASPFTGPVGPVVACSGIVIVAGGTIVMYYSSPENQETLEIAGRQLQLEWNKFIGNQAPIYTPAQEPVSVEPIQKKQREGGMPSEHNKISWLSGEKIPEILKYLEELKNLPPTKEIIKRIKEIETHLKAVKWKHNRHKF